MEGTLSDQGCHEVGNKGSLFNELGINRMLSKGETLPEKNLPEILLTSGRVTFSPIGC
jgi:hypothetical protein